jgi:hypothetical protein
MTPNIPNDWLPKEKRGRSQELPPHLSVRKCYRFGWLIVRIRFGCEHSLEAPLFVLIMQHHYRHYAQRMLAAPAGGSLALQILNESIGEVVRSSRTPCSFGALRAALRASKLHTVFQRIAVQRGPARIPNTYSFF